jgi:hypothetical protein
VAARGARAAASDAGDWISQQLNSSVQHPPHEAPPGRRGIAGVFPLRSGQARGSGVSNLIQTRVAISASPFREGTVLRGAVSKETPTMIRQIIIAEIGFQFGFVLVTLFAAS